MADLSSKEVGLSLIEASYDGQYSTVSYLVNNLPLSSLDETSTVKKVGSSEGDLHNCTALNIACIKGYTDIAKLLLEAGASHSIRDCTGSTPFSEAVYHNRLQLVDLLPQFGADVNAVNSFGWTPLHVAAFQGRIEIVRRLLELGADVTSVTPEGYTPMHMATLTGKSSIVKYLLEKGISPSFVEADPTQESYTPCPLFLAVVGHFKSLVNKFLQHPSCPLSCTADAMMLMGAVDVLDSRVSEAQSKWSNGLQFREKNNIPFHPSPCDGYGGRCEISDLTELGKLFEKDSIEIDAIYQSILMWERCVGTLDQRYWVCLRHLIEKLVGANQNQEAGKAIIRGLTTIECSQLPLLEEGCILPQNFEVFLGDTLMHMVYPQLADRTVTFEVAFAYVFKALDVLISRGSVLYTTFGCPNFVPKFLLGVVLQMLELWLTLELTPDECESRERIGQNFVSKYLYLTDGSNILFIILQSPCQNQTRLFEALLAWGADKAINSSYQGQRLLQRVLNVEEISLEQFSVIPPVLKLLVSYGLHGDAVDRSGKTAFECCPELFDPRPFPLACLTAHKIIQENLPYQDMVSVAPRLKTFIMMHDSQALIR